MENAVLVAAANALNVMLDTREKGAFLPENLIKRNQK